MRFAAPDALREMFSGPPAVTRDEVIQQRLRAFCADFVWRAERGG